MNSSPIKLLWLASWYPNETDAYSGDFIQRHAEAVSLISPVRLIYASKKPAGSSIESLTINIVKKENLEEYFLTYPSRAGKNRFSSGPRSLIQYFRVHRSLIREWKEKGELPQIIHLHVAMKAGIIALYLKWKYKIPYVLTEHWTGYFSESKHSLNSQPFIIRWLTRKILINADKFLPVSNNLGEQIRKHWSSISFQKIPNVVNTDFFHFAGDHHSERFRFIHISTLVHPKNPEGIVRAFTALIEEGIVAELVMVGPLNDQIIEAISKTGLNHAEIQCTGEISYEEVGIEIRKSSALVMFSFYENLSCVVLESLCCGVPVISSRVGGIPEAVNEENGILIEAGNEKELKEAMRLMIKKYHQYDRYSISKKASELYSYQTVGNQIMQVYQEVLQKQ